MQTKPLLKAGAYLALAIGEAWATKTPLHAAKQWATYGQTDAVHICYGFAIILTGAAITFGTIGYKRAKQAFAPGLHA